MYWSADTWEFIATAGAWLVIIGVAGEGVDIAIKLAESADEHSVSFRQWLLKTKRDKWIMWCSDHELLIDATAGLFWMLVVLGLMIEFKGGHEANKIHALDNALLHLQANTLGQQTAELVRSNIWLAGQVELAYSNNLVLLRETTDLWQSVEPRTLGEQISIALALASIPNIKVRLSSNSSRDSLHLAGEFRGVLGGIFVTGRWTTVEQRIENEARDGVLIEYAPRALWAGASFSETFFASEDAAVLMLRALTERGIAAIARPGWEIQLSTNMIAVTIGDRPSRFIQQNMIHEAKIELLRYDLGKLELPNFLPGSEDWRRWNNDAPARAPKIDSLKKQLAELESQRSILWDSFSRTAREQVGALQQTLTNRLK